jgi:hypothetical protein
MLTRGRPLIYVNHGAVPLGACIFSPLGNLGPHMCQAGFPFYQVYPVKKLRDFDGGVWAAQGLSSTGLMNLLRRNRELWSRPD